MITGIALAFALVLAAVPAPADAPPKYDMTTYTLVLVRPGPGLPPSAEERARIEEGHRALLVELTKSGKLVAGGTIEGGEDLLEVLVLDVSRVEEARPLLEADPWVAARLRTLELHPWFAARGILRAPNPAGPTERISFGLLRRPASAPQLPPEKLKEIQSGHMKNLEAMAASGDLAIAGPLGDDGTIRGVFVFRGTDQAHLREIAAPDAAIAAGRLALDLWTWVVPEGTLPPR
jgi:uncharacterized protein YciI